MADSSSIGAPPQTPTGLRRFFLAFQVPSFRWLWLNGLFVSVVWAVEGMGQGWLVLQLTNDSPFWVGVAAGIRGIGQLVFAVPAGALADRLDRRKLLILVQIVTGLMTLVMALLVISDAVRLWHVLVYVALAGMITSASQPTNNALTYDVVGASRILNAGALRFMGMSTVRIVGSLAGGFIIEAVGVGGIYVLAFSVYLPAVIALLRMKSPANPSRSPEPFAQAVVGGLLYALRHRPVGRLLLVSVLTEFFGFSYIWMVPVMAKNVLEVGATGLGYLNAAGAVGQLVAMIVLASLGDVRNKGWLLVVAILGFGVSLVLFGLSPWFPVSLILIAVVSGMSGVYDSTMAALLQMTTSSEMRGRMMGLYVSTWGSNQVGGFVIGSMARLAGAPVALAVGGGVLVTNALRVVSLVRRINADLRKETPAPTP
ncbi:MAG: MFS transporter, partial [Chloroflexi bacterium]|nr:MFS transporter [Chloroflexota bacterium]